MPCACQIPVPVYPDNADWGPLVWTLLHGLAEKSGRAPLPSDEVRAWQKLITLTADMLPCDKCRAHYSAFLKANPPSQLSQIPYSDVKRWVRSWFFTLHNEVNVQANKPVFSYDDLSAQYSNVNFQDVFWRLEPDMKKAIDLNGISLNKWTSWVHSYKMLKAAMGI